MNYDCDSTPKHKLHVSGTSDESTHYFQCYDAFNRVPRCHSIGKALQVQFCVDSGLSHIVQLIEIMIMQLGP